MKFRVWWIPQIPMKAFRVAVDTIDEAALILDTLANYDLFQYHNRVKPDYSNAGGLEVFENGEWTEWDDGDGRDIDAWMENVWTRRQTVEKVR